MQRPSSSHHHVAAFRVSFCRPIPYLPCFPRQSQQTRQPLCRFIFMLGQFPAHQAVALVTYQPTSQLFLHQRTSALVCLLDQRLLAAVTLHAAMTKLRPYARQSLLLSWPRQLPMHTFNPHSHALNLYFSISPWSFQRACILLHHAAWQLPSLNGLAIKAIKIDGKRHWLARIYKRRVRNKQKRKRKREK